jgi:hypothetical protein
VFAHEQSVEIAKSLGPALAAFAHDKLVSITGQGKPSFT